MKSTAPQCAKCMVRRCRPGDKRDKPLPDLCPTKNYPDIIKESVEQNKTDPEVRAINLAWAELLARVYQNRWSWTRIDEVMEYAKIRGIKKLGVAFCVALQEEARLLNNILEVNGFDVVSVCCISGEVAPKDVDIVREGGFCNPIMQAEVLNREGTELNIMIGLCVGHDILFIRNSKADVTPLIVKDRALGHNPAIALYLSETYYQQRFFQKS